MAKGDSKPDEGKAIAIIAGALAIGASAQATAASLSPLLRMPASTLLPILVIAMSRPVSYTNIAIIPSATASSEASGLEPSFRAAYVLAASRRIDGLSGDDLREALRRERGYFNQHIEAMRKRRSAASQVDLMRARYGDELGWYAKMDSLTSAECRQANGKNFSASRIPGIGFPGAVHPNCRCRAGRKHATSQTVYGIKPDRSAA